MRVARGIPADKVEWTYRDGQFTLGDLAAAHCDHQPLHVRGDGFRAAEPVCQVAARNWPTVTKQVLGFAERLHREAVAIFSQLSSWSSWAGNARLPTARRSRSGSGCGRWWSVRVHHRGADLSVSQACWGWRRRLCCRTDVRAGSGAERAGLTGGQRLSGDLGSRVWRRGWYRGVGVAAAPLRRAETPVAPSFETAGFDRETHEDQARSHHQHCDAHGFGGRAGAGVEAAGDPWLRLCPPQRWHNARSFQNPRSNNWSRHARWGGRSAECG